MQRIAVCLCCGAAINMSDIPKKKDFQEDAYPDYPQEEIIPVQLTKEQATRLRNKSAKGILNTLFAQLIAGLIVVVVCWVFFSSKAAVSALIGVMAYFIPNTLFALRMFLGMFSAAQQSAYSFFWAEFLKLALAAAMLGFFGYYLHDWLVWPAMLLGLIAVLKGYAVLLFFNKLP